MVLKEVKEIIWAFGHENIQSIHPTTLMFTKETDLSKKGDCIIAAAADKSVADLSIEFKNVLRQPDSTLTITIEAGDKKEQIKAYGSPKLILTNNIDIVIRKSKFLCNRTLAIQADKASNDLSKKFIEKLKRRKQKIKITLIVKADY